jgi:hypothetical protein
MKKETEEYVFIDRRKQPFILTDKLVVLKWLPFIEPTGFAIYSIYICLVNKDTGYAFPSLNRLSKFLQKDKKTVIKYNRLLEQHGLITIERIQSPNGDFTSNRYYINDVMNLPPDLARRYDEIRLVEKDPFTHSLESDAQGGGGMIPLPSGMIPPRVVESFHHVVESFHPKETNIIKTNIKETLSPSESEIQIPENSLFEAIPVAVIQNLAAQYSSDSIKEAVQSLDRTYHNRRKEIRSPLALLKTALKEGFEPVKVPPWEAAVNTAEEPDEAARNIDAEWQQIQEKQSALPIEIIRSWQEFLGELGNGAKSQAFDAWFTPLVPISIEADELLVYSPSQIIEEQIEKKWRRKIDSVLGRGRYPFKQLRVILE